jgi:2-dehydro-3-deoxyphosphogluconate aldolase/(4S)-4-hydroxy-2-oxoglutarate aldolase
MMFRHPKIVVPHELLRVRTLDDHRGPTRQQEGLVVSAASVVEERGRLPRELLERLEQKRVVPVMSVSDAEVAEAACRALASAGLSCAEITFRTDAAVEAIARVARIDGFLVGAGTVLSEQQARLAHRAGAAFAVSPGTNERLLETCRELGLPFIPGAATATEIDRARVLGCAAVKLFPAELLGGPRFISAMSSVFPQMRFLPTGGIGPANLPAYLALASVLACGGSWLVDQKLLGERRFDEIERLAREALGSHR